MTQTIVSQLTPPGSAALGVIAVYGPRAVEIVRSLFQHGEKALEAGRLRYGWFGVGARDDVVIFASTRNAASCVEVCCHGGAAIIEQLIADLVERGAERFDWRGFEECCGRSEFQCDALEALTSAATPKVAAILLDQLNGALDRALADARGNPAVANDVLKWTNIGRLLERPARVVLFGLPNAGKSTLFNALAGYSRIVTSSQPGTTRDLVSEVVVLDGWPIELVDGAGLREDAAPLEAEGIRRLTAALEIADLRVLVSDASASRDPVGDLVAGFRPDLFVANKMDLRRSPTAWTHSIECSATTGQGVDEIRRAIVSSLVPEIPPPGIAIPFRDRHQQIFQNLFKPSGV